MRFIHYQQLIILINNFNQREKSFFFLGLFLVARLIFFSLDLTFEKSAIVSICVVFGNISITQNLVI
ncbi:MAG: hypothetical protein OFPII_32850 [Osedax symbiont Rs1]|nr:MAG: hypothetical protein OFPII_32850 [Osedax symbiont Rs1]